jgi:hypothetical protein
MQIPPQKFFASSGEAVKKPALQENGLFRDAFPF